MDDVLFIFDSCIRGYHLYKDLWNATLGETLACIKEWGNRNNAFTVAVQSDSNIVGHVHRHISCICMLFIHTGGLLNCLITGSRRYFRDLPQERMEIPCQHIFSGNEDLIKKIRGCLEELQGKVSVIRENSRSIPVSSSPSVTSQAAEHKSTSTYALASVNKPSTSLQSPAEGDCSWVKIKDISLKISDRTIIEQGLELTDLHVNSAQRLIKNQFPKLNSLKLSLLQAQPLQASTVNATKIFHISGNHWIVAATGKSGKVYKYMILHTPHLIRHRQY